MQNHNETKFVEWIVFSLEWNDEVLDEVVRYDSLCINPRNEQMIDDDEIQLIFDFCESLLMMENKQELHRW